MVTVTTGDLSLTVTELSFASVSLKSLPFTIDVDAVDDYLPERLPVEVLRAMKTVRGKEAQLNKIPLSKITEAATTSSLSYASPGSDDLGYIHSRGEIISAMIYQSQGYKNEDDSLLIADAVPICLAQSPEPPFLSLYNEAIPGSVTEDIMRTCIVDEPQGTNFSRPSFTDESPQTNFHLQENAATGNLLASFLQDQETEKTEDNLFTGSCNVDIYDANYRIESQSDSCSQSQYLLCQKYQNESKIAESTNLKSAGLEQLDDAGILSSQQFKLSTKPSRSMQIKNTQNLSSLLDRIPSDLTAQNIALAYDVKELTTMCNSVGVSLNWRASKSMIIRRFTELVKSGVTVINNFFYDFRNCKLRC